MPERDFIVIDGVGLKFPKWNPRDQLTIKLAFGRLSQSIVTILMNLSGHRDRVTEVAQAFEILRTSVLIQKDFARGNIQGRVMRADDPELPNISTPFDIGTLLNLYKRYRLPEDLGESRSKR